MVNRPSVTVLGLGRRQWIAIIAWLAVNGAFAIYQYYAIMPKCGGVYFASTQWLGETNQTCARTNAMCCKPIDGGPLGLTPTGVQCPVVCQPACNLFGRIMGHLLCLNLGLILLPVARNSVWTYFLGVPFERALKFHRMLGRAIFIIMSTHLTTWWISYPVGSEAWDCLSWTFYFSSPMFVGQLAWICHAIAAGLAFEFFRRRVFELFYYTHQLYIAVFVFAVWHTTLSQQYGLKDLLYFKTDYFVYYIIPGVLLHLRDRLIRLYRSRFVRTELVAATRIWADGTSIVRLEIERKDLVYEPGQYCFLCIPEISPLQWHPFSISSSPVRPGFHTHHVMSMGSKTWTGALQKLVAPQTSSSGEVTVEDPSFRVLVDGPYGRPSIDPKQFPVLAFVAGGIGITPLIGMLTDLVDRAHLYPNLRAVYLGWSVRSARQLSWFGDFWTRLAAAGRADYPSSRYSDEENYDAGTGDLMRVTRINGIDYICEFYVTGGVPISSRPGSLVQHDEPRVTVAGVTTTQLPHGNTTAATVAAAAPIKTTETTSLLPAGSPVSSMDYGYQDEHSSTGSRRSGHTPPRVRTAPTAPTPRSNLGGRPIGSNAASAPAYPCIGGRLDPAGFLAAIDDAHGTVLAPSGKRVRLVDPERKGSMFGLEVGVFVCGPASMVRATREACQSRDMQCTFRLHEEIFFL